MATENSAMLKIELINSTITHIEQSLKNLSESNQELVSAVARLAGQMTEIVELKKTVVKNDRDILELQIRLKAIEDVAKNIETLKVAVNRHTWVNQIGIFAATAVASGLIALLFKFNR